MNAMHKTDDTTAEIRRFFEGALKGEARVCLQNLRFFNEIDSTNTFLKREAENAAVHGSVAIAASQSAGRGRLGRSFYSPSGTGLYMSALCVNDGEAAQSLCAAPALFTTSAAVAVARAVKRVCGIELGIKWVNDLYLNGRKICGILAEAVPRGENPLYAVVVGIGLNIQTRDFPPELRDKAGSLFGAADASGGSGANAGAFGTGADFAEQNLRFALAAEILNELFAAYSAASAESRAEIMREYKERSVVLGKTIEVLAPDGSYKALARDITASGELQVVCKDGTLKLLNSGEVSVAIF